MIVPKGWGHEQIIVNTDAYCGKLLVFSEGRQASWHYHEKKDETFYLLSGNVQVLVGDDDDRTNATAVVMKIGDSLRLTPGKRHQVFAFMDSVIAEFSTHDDPADSIRVIKGD